MDRIPKKIDSKYRYVLLASQRAEQLIQGAQPKTEVDSPKHTRLGMQEITEGAVEWGVCYGRYFLCSVTVQEVQGSVTHPFEHLRLVRRRVPELSFEADVALVADDALLVVFDLAILLLVILFEPRSQIELR